MCATVTEAEKKCEAEKGGKGRGGRRKGKGCSTHKTGMLFADESITGEIGRAHV